MNDFLNVCYIYDNLIHSVVIVCNNYEWLSEYIHSFLLIGSIQLIESKKIQSNPINDEDDWECVIILRLIIIEQSHQQ